MGVVSTFGSWKSQMEATVTAARLLQEDYRGPTILGESEIHFHGSSAPALVTEIIRDGFYPRDWGTLGLSTARLEPLFDALVLIAEHMEEEDWTRQVVLVPLRSNRPVRYALRVREIRRFRTDKSPRAEAEAAVDRAMRSWFANWRGRHAMAVTD